MKLLDRCGNVLNKTLQAEWYIDETRPRRDWPDEGKVAFENYATRYRAGLDLVLKGITADVSGGEKVRHSEIMSFTFTKLYI